MSTLNLGLQCEGLMREKGDADFEAEVAKCNSLVALRDAADRVPNFRSSALDSMAHVKSFLTMLLGRLELKRKQFSSYASCTEVDIDSMWSELSAVDSSLKKDESMSKKSLPSKHGLVAFLNHCCTCRHYSFQIKKCGSDTCNMCKQVKLPKEVFDTLHVLPDPVPGEDGHYKNLDELLGTETDGSHRPSLQKTPKRKKTLPFSVSLQHVKNVDLMLQCDKCAMWIFKI